MIGFEKQETGEAESAWETDRGTLSPVGDEQLFTCLGRAMSESRTRSLGTGYTCFDSWLFLSFTLLTSRPVLMSPRLDDPSLVLHGGSSAWMVLVAFFLFFFAFSLHFAPFLLFDYMCAGVPIHTKQILKKKKDTQSPSSIQPRSNPSMSQLVCLLLIGEAPQRRFLHRCCFLCALETIEGVSCGGPFGMW